MKHVQRYTVHPHQMASHSEGQPLGTEDIPVVRAGDFDRIVERLMSREAMLAELLFARPLLVHGPLWIERIEGVLADSEPAHWSPVESGLPPEGIRVIAACGTHVLGDCFIGQDTSAKLDPLVDKPFSSQQLLKCWRYCASREPVPANLQPTAYRPLPVAPVFGVKAQ